MENQPLISVVVATYNGAKYLAAQLDSIFNQTYSNLEVIVCDDLSTDDTTQILREYEVKHGLRYFVNEARQGVVKNFERAISKAKGGYIALSDQDDVWLPQKLERSLQRLQQLEATGSAGEPALVFSDLTVVDENLRQLSPSYWHYMQLNPDNTKLNRILVENVVTGCTAFMNRATVNLALPIPRAAIMHDVWFLLVASSFGQVAYLPEPTVLYRQHSQNVVGARHKGLMQKLQSGLDKLSSNNFSLLQAEIEQARAFYEKYEKQLSAQPGRKAMLEDFITLKRSGFLTKKYRILKHSFYGSTLKKALNVLVRA
jgi:glycosyltransferase involved in cell wall biosynthesis